ncbi:hypothetical protein EPD60_14580 [Flaviaesturariibacter flavus]|uniref:Uncharacterized protein n=1 Tax=Flaviaesturariibacter flavus TaxID=2502780 RepID=A0A4R1B7H7_9BACT|nr:DUF6702 family protein [Flaviaesturariibacter flavus]TCJ12498.1 hypothetical protein EPD60_14580 [Flaviaesturariibacter flavus]
MALLSFKWFLPLLASFFHPFYVSVTEITHNAREKEYEISCKMFAEDLEQTLRKQHKLSVDLSSDAQHAQNDKLVAAYMQAHLAVSADGKALKLHYLGFERDKEAVWCYFDVPGDAPKKVDVQTSILHDFTEKQINIVHVSVYGKRQSQKIDYPNRGASFNF